MTSTKPKSHRYSRKPRKGSWVPHFLGLDDFRTDAEKLVLARALRAEIEREEAKK